MAAEIEGFFKNDLRDKIVASKIKERQFSNYISIY